MRRAVVGIAQEEPRQFDRMIVLATVGAVAYSVTLPLIRIYSIAADPLELGHVNVALTALALYLPVQIWLVFSATRREGGVGQMLALIAMAVVIFSAMPAVGVGWVGMVYVLAALALVSVRAPWSFVLFGLLMAAPTPLTFAFGHPEWALYFTIGLPFTSVPLAVGIWLIRVARQLQEARLALAEQAIGRERLGIDLELRDTVGIALEGIAAGGERATTLASSDPVGAASQVRAVVTSARRTLAEARRMSMRYREVSLRAELETTATLLSAAGIDARLELPVEPLPETVDDQEKARFRREVARVIGNRIPPSLAITVTRDDDGGWRLNLASDAEPSKAEVEAG